ncbi:MAG: polysaccharide deacetylase family protein [Beijerinckiaceae bacterium]
MLEADGSALGIARVLASETERTDLASKLAELILEHKLEGLTIDLDSFEPRTLPNLYRLVASLRERTASEKTTLVLIASSRTPANLLRVFSNPADLLLYRLYAPYAPAQPTAPAPQGLVEQHVRVAKSSIPVSKLGFVIGSFGYEWRNAGPARMISIQSAWNELAREGARADFDPNSLATTINGRDKDGHPTRIWMSDAVSGFNAARVAFGAQPKAIAICCLGFEDPSVWSFAGRGKLPDETALDQLRAPPGGFSSTQTLSAVLVAFKKRTSGVRKITFNEHLGLVTSATIEKAPTGVIKSVWKAQVQDTVALTFDDGPSPEFTPKILDILKQKGVKATFYILGYNASAYPALVKRIYDEGHDIGNHSYSHQPLTASRERAFTELNATQRALESAAGVRTKLFRPPYMTPYSAIEREMETIYVGTELGYVIAGYDIETFDSLASSAQIHRAAVDGADGGGRIVLLHDAGGNRNPTIEALPKIIDDLHARGLRFVTTHELAGWTRDQVMPPATDVGYISNFALGLSMSAIRVWDYLPQIALVTAGFGIIRLLLIIIGATIQRRRTLRAGQQTVALGSDTVEVLVPAYNEEKVICATVQTLLESSVGDRISVLVIDDGSSDRTAAVIMEQYGDDRRVRVITKPNGGKSAALNFGVEMCRADIIVAIDGDTILHPLAIERLLARFEDQSVGAVAGNVVVGNEINLITRFQSLEYICAQNLDRRALELVNAISVVPGAIGAWRREAMIAAGGYSHDTLAEDADLTVTIERLGWRVVAEPRALAYTEAPETLSAFVKQRRRWTFGTLQVAYKHFGSIFGKPSGVGLVTIPNILIYQFAFTLLAALMDILLVLTLVTWMFGAASSGLALVALYWAVFQVVDVGAAAVGLWMNGEARKFGLLVLVPLQRFTYRQLLYWVTFGALKSAIMGHFVGWGKLLRTGRAKASADAPG